MSKLITFSYVVIFGIMSVSPKVSCAIDAETEQRIDDFVDALLVCRDLVSLNLAVVKGNETLISKGYGVANFETGANVTNETLYGLASLSKAFAATLLGHVLESRFVYALPFLSEL